MMAVMALRFQFIIIYNNTNTVTFQKELNVGGKTLEEAYKEGT